MKALFRWQPDGVTLVAFLAGLVAVGLSLLMLVVPVWASIVARDVLQVFVVGILLVPSLTSSIFSGRGGESALQEHMRFFR